MSRCLTGARFSMNAEILTWQPRTSNVHSPVESWVGIQDPITLEVIDEWVPPQADDPNTVEDEYVATTIDCLARGIVDGGIRVAGTTERFGDVYENVDFVKLWTPAHVRLTKRDRITNIRWKKNGEVIWIDEEYVDGIRPTTFNVNGVTPLFDAFNRHIENYVMLERTEQAFHEG